MWVVYQELLKSSQTVTARYYHAAAFMGNSFLLLARNFYLDLSARTLHLLTFPAALTYIRGNRTRSSEWVHFKQESFFRIPNLWVRGWKYMYVNNNENKGTWGESIDAMQRRCQRRDRVRQNQTIVNRLRGVEIMR